MTFSPILVTTIDLTDRVPTLSPGRAGTGFGYEHARCLVLLAGEPVGFADFDLSHGDLLPAEVSKRCWQQLGPEITDGVRRLGLSESTEANAVASLPIAAPHSGEPRGSVVLDATVVIATRDRPDSLRRCLQSILAMDDRPREVIVVDNASTDGATRLVVEETTCDGLLVTYVREDRPGLAAAHNAAIGHVRTSFVAFTDDDVLVDRRWLTRLVEAFGASTGVACVTGMIIPAELETQEQAWIEQYAGFNKGFERRLFDLRSNRPDDPLFPFTAGSLGSGANMAFATEFLRRLGGFDPALGAGSGAFGGDDLAAFHDVIVSGATLVYEPSAIVAHFHHRGYDALARQVYGYGAGLTAYLTHCAVEQPRSIPSMMRKVAGGIAHALAPQSSKNVRRVGDYPRQLTNAERRGMLLGPFVYLRTRRRRRDEYHHGASLQHPFESSDEVVSWLG